MINIEGIHHVSVAVTDLTRAKAFYESVLGLQEIPRPNFITSGAWYALGCQQLHLIVYPKGQTLRPNGGIDTSDGHIAIRVADYEEAILQLKKCGIDFVERPTSTAGFPQIFLTDPDGNVIELNADVPS